MRVYDLRSDTVTQPSKMMREAIANAVVGDDVLQEDPTVKELESLAASMLGKEAALFVPTGSMGNLIALYLNGGRATEVLCHKSSHIIHMELGSISSIAGCLPIGIDTPRGILTAEAIKPHIKEIAYDHTPASLIEVENTIGGICYPLENLQAIKALAEEHSLLVHMDGARLFNAAVATNESVKTLASCADTVTFCVSKGLGAPVGSLLCGPQEFIKKAKVVRKMLGSGMRQVGIIAAAGLYALQNNIDKLAIDHANAQLIAKTLSETSWADIVLEDVETNIMFIKGINTTAEKIVEVLKKHNILALSSNDKVRLVTNLDISEQDTLEVCQIIKSIELSEFH